MEKEQVRRDELANFLRTRRARLHPTEVGLPGSTRRRTPGLRREELALLADVGVTWYTWLEQGRDISVSTQVLERLADALRLDRAERTHLHMLAHQSLPLQAVPEAEHLTANHQRILEALPTTPALWLGRRWDLLDWNPAATKLFGDFNAQPAEERNLLRYLFLNAYARCLFAEWEQTARQLMAQFRSGIGCYVGDQPLTELIESLCAANAEFRDWWPQHNILGSSVITIPVEHPVEGSRLFEATLLHGMENPTLRLMLFTPI